ncbi:HD domain-containing phosphohydrolase [Paenibacillus radicis (ex Xue et al. 2023)]|uniref:HD domain-containing protein n=1 Tax=Paenibacillus radicis (ex Xue et al. 2023) TaxID=2972489 RepID=A0ABT1YFE4_9BACL|nr:HD domain-containing phosphohydrolase [Paenibacillus radicis (ex Xue et al. 2023)]MCR8631923.1 HD domain-containing protein [Paenibacillus radicis (ex Xue et al. 2023)]
MEESLKPFLLLSDAVIITDINHRILDVNKTYEDITGYSREQILGFRAGILKTRLTSESTYHEMHKALNQLLSWSGVFVNKKRNGELWHSSISITPFLINGDTYYVGVFRELEHLQEGIYIAEGRRSGIQAALLKVLAISCEIRDPAIEEHLTRVQQLTGQLIHAHNERLQLGLSQDYIQSIIHASIMHDIGKSGVPEGILYKPGPLTSYERIIIEMHPLIGVDILEKINAELDDDFFKEELNVAKNIILSHHEKWDGSGYPHQLKANDIPFEARIVSVVDVYDALTSRRPYKEIWDKQKAIGFLREHQGTFFDPAIIDTFVQIV